MSEVKHTPIVTEVYINNFKIKLEYNKLILTTALSEESPWHVTLLIASDLTVVTTPCTETGFLDSGPSIQIQSILKKDDINEAQIIWHQVLFHHKILKK